MVEVNYYRTHVRLYNVDVTICEDGRIYIIILPDFQTDTIMAV